MKETLIQQEIRAALNQRSECRLFRNNTGQLRNEAGGYVRFGLAVGSADLVGVLKPWGRFFALEIKTPSGRLTVQQKEWARTIRDFGGFVACVRSVDEALAALERAAAGEKE